jgi:hypothetical protein
MVVVPIPTIVTWPLASTVATPVLLLANSTVDVLSLLNAFVNAASVVNFSTVLFANEALAAVQFAQSSALV